jgi:hypothetical protein
MAVFRDEWWMRTTYLSEHRMRTAAAIDIERTSAHTYYDRVSFYWQILMPKEENPKAIRIEYLSCRPLTPTPTPNYHRLLRGIVSLLREY